MNERAGGLTDGQPDGQIHNAALPSASLWNEKQKEGVIGRGTTAVKWKVVCVVSLVVVCVCVCV